MVKTIGAKNMNEIENVKGEIFKRKARALAKKHELVRPEYIDAFVEDIYKWYIDHNHRDMTEAEYDELILPYLR